MDSALSGTAAAGEPVHEAQQQPSPAVGPMSRSSPKRRPLAKRTGIPREHFLLIPTARVFRGETRHGRGNREACTTPVTAMGAISISIAKSTPHPHTAASQYCCYPLLKRHCSLNYQITCLILLSTSIQSIVITMFLFLDCPTISTTPST